MKKLVISALALFIAGFSASTLAEYKYAYTCNIKYEHWHHKKEVKKVSKKVITALQRCHVLGTNKDGKPTAMAAPSVCQHITKSKHGKNKLVRFCYSADQNSCLTHKQKVPLKFIERYYDCKMTKSS